MFEIYIVLALGALPLAHMYHLKNFKFLTPQDDSCPLWLKSDYMRFQEQNDRVTICIEPPPPPPPTTDLMGPPWGQHVPFETTLPPIPLRIIPAMFG